VRDADRQLLVRQMQRMQWLMWTLLRTGVYNVTNEVGTVVHQDGYTVTTYAASDWSTVGTADPLADLRAIQLLPEGTSADFGPDAIILVNRRTANYLLANTNTASMAGKRVNGGSTLNTMEDVNRIFAGEGLPQIVVYSDGYYDDNGTFQLWIPNDYAIVIGRFNGSTELGEFRRVRHADNPGAAPGPFLKITDTARNPNAPPPRQVRVYRGQNGGPVIWYPGSVVVMRV
jgi:hypothetical protein